MHNAESSSHLGPPPYTVSKVADCVAVLLMAGSIGFYIQAVSGGVGGAFLLFLESTLLLIVNLLFASPFWRAMSLVVLLTVSSASTYQIFVVQPREKAQFDQMVAQGMRQLMAERLKKDEEQKKKVRPGN